MAFSCCTSPGKIIIEIAKEDPSLRSAMIEVAESFASATIVQQAVAGQPTTVTLPGGHASLKVPAGALEGDAEIAVREYDCKYVASGGMSSGGRALGYHRTLLPRTFS